MLEFIIPIMWLTSTSTLKHLPDWAIVSLLVLQRWITDHFNRNISIKSPEKRLSNAYLYLKFIVVMKYQNKLLRNKFWKIIHYPCSPICCIVCGKSYTNTFPDKKWVQNCQSQKHQKTGSYFLLKRRHQNQVR